MRIKTLPSVEVLRARFTYNSESGIIIRLTTGRDGFPTVSNKGYKQGYVPLFGNSFAHRVAFKLMTGNDAPDQIDHINGIKADNRWVNLRPVLHAENQRNCCISRNNTSGHNGVSFDVNRGMWLASIKVDGKNYYLGRFVILADARAARKAADDAFGFHGNHGRSASVGA